MSRFHPFREFTRRRFSTLNFRVGQKHKGFDVSNIVPCEDFNLIAYQFVHRNSGALYYHLQRADPNNAFTVSFRTPPKDNTGVAHILEHTALCGSKRYPVRDPFFLLLRRSLKTFMNAMTASDFTTYPFSTQNKQDYDNLLSVYLDAAFFPNLQQMDFLQEGHRLEFEKATDPSSKLMYKGVVFNEMKGAMSDSSSIYNHKLVESLFPSGKTTYHFNSGGDPQAIPNLTYSQLKEFHQRHYHPSNAAFFTYGDMGPHLDQIEENVLSKFSSQPLPKLLSREPRLSEPRKVKITGPVDPLAPDPAKQTKVSLAVLCKPLPEGASEDEQVVHSFGLSLLSTLLIDGPTSPMYKALIDPNYGNGYAPGVGYDNHTYDASISIGLQGIKEEDADKIVDIINQTLIKVSKEGFPAERIEAVLHQWELSLKEIRSHFGINLLFRLSQEWAHYRNNPLNALHVNRHIETLKQKLKQGGYFEGLIKEHLLENQHKIVMIMTPDEAYSEKLLKEEQEKLSVLQSKLGEEKKKAIVQQAVELKTRQEQKLDASCLPSLRASDIKPDITIYPFQKSAHRGKDLWWLNDATNGLGYYRGLVSIDQMDPELLPYLPLYTSFFGSIGAGKLQYDELSHEIDMYTGGIDSGIHIFNSLDSLLHSHEYLSFSGKALARNTSHLFQLLHDVVTKPNTTNLKRIQSLLIQNAAALSNSLLESGLGFARTDAASTLTPAGAAGEKLFGVTHVKFVNSLVEKPEESAALVAEKFRQITEFILKKGLNRSLVTGDDVATEKIKAEMDQLLGALSPSTVEKPAQPAAFRPDQKPRKTFFALPIQVNNVSLCVPTVPYTHPDAPILMLLAQILSQKFLHREIREKGGAYGGGAAYSRDGIFSFHSYRDPESVNTMETFLRAGEWALQDGNIEAQDIEEGLLSRFSSLDAPVSPKNKGDFEFLTGVTDAQRQEFRSRLLSVTKQKLLDGAARYLHPEALARSPLTVVGDQTRIPASITQEAATQTPVWQVQYLNLNPPTGK